MIASEGQPKINSCIPPLPVFIVVICFPVDDVINFGINFSFPPSRFLNDQKNQDKSLNNLRTKRALKVKWEAFVIIYKGLSVVRNCVRPGSGRLISEL